VRANIEGKLDEILDDTLQKLDPDQQPIEDVVEVLLVKEKELKREVRFLEETSDNYLKYFERFVDPWTFNLDKISSLFPFLRRIQVPPGSWKCRHGGAKENQA